jgi:hypothetical protein
VAYEVCGHVAAEVPGVAPLLKVFLVPHNEPVQVIAEKCKDGRNILRNQPLPKFNLPRIYWEPRQPRLKRQELALDLKGGAEVAGATLSNPEPVLSVRTK